MDKLHIKHTHTKEKSDMMKWKIMACKHETNSFIALFFSNLIFSPSVYQKWVETVYKHKK